MDAIELGDLPPVLVIEEVAPVMRCCERTVHRMLNRGELKGAKIGGKWRILREDVLALLGAGQ